MSTAAEHIEPPSHLSDESKALWARIVAESVIDSPAAVVLRTLCEANDRRNQAREAISAEGAVYKDRFGAPKLNPYVSIERDQTLVMHRAFRLLGFDQESRGDSQGELFSL